MSDLFKKDVLTFFQKISKDAEKSNTKIKIRRMKIFFDLIFTDLNGKEISEKYGFKYHNGRTLYKLLYRCCGYHKVPLLGLKDIKKFKRRDKFQVINVESKQKKDHKQFEELK